MVVGFNRQKGVEREENDFYATDPSAVQPLMDFLGWNGLCKFIWENSCGEGHLSKPLVEAGHIVLSTDLIDRGYGQSGVDFLQETPYDDFAFEAVVMNPPYKFAQQFIEKSLRVAPIVCAFLRLAFLESRKRAKFFDENPPKYVCVFRDRVPCSKNAEFSPKESSTVCYAWFIWERGYKGDPVVKRF